MSKTKTKRSIKLRAKVDKLCETYYGYGLRQIRFFTPTAYVDEDEGGLTCTLETKTGQLMIAHSRHGEERCLRRYWLLTMSRA